MDYLIILKEIASEFRDAIELACKRKMFRSDHFNNFPYGCCGDAAELLSKYYYDKGIQVKYISGIRDEQSHAWLACNGIIIDITADQFPDIEDKVIVTFDKKWHNQFRIERELFVDFDRIDEHAKIRLNSIFKVIIDTMV